MPDEQVPPLERALSVLGPLERRIMRVLWTGKVGEPFIVRDVHAHISDLAYTTLMTTLNRLVEKKILALEPNWHGRAHGYRVIDTPESFLLRSSRTQVDQVIQRFGDSAIAAFTERLDGLSAERLEQLRKLGRR